MNMQLRILLGVCIAMAASSQDSDCFIKPFARNITVEVGDILHKSRIYVDIKMNRTKLTPD